MSLGHTRLSILDLSSNGHQPMLDKQGSIAITFNGEIYNYQDLWGKLSKKYDFKSSTDTEVLIYAYKEWGLGFVNKLEGMFAFCIYDFEQKRLILARDRLGEKPLYYHWDYSNPGKFVFSSEIKGILACGVSAKVNQSAISEYLSLGYVNSQSAFQNIYKVLPGEMLVFDLGGGLVAKWKYWNLKYIPENRYSEDYFKKHILEYLEKSVKNQIVADVPVGAFLSGGIDSTALCAFIKKHKENLKTFSIGFEHKEFDESGFARKASDFLNTEHYETIFQADDILNLLNKLTDSFDEPFSDPAMIPTYLVSKVARKHVTVCLSGDGGDESLGGYERYALYNKLKWHSYTPAPITKYIFRPLIKTAYALTKKHVFNKGLMLLEDDKLAKHEIYAKTMAITTNKEVFKLFKPYFKNELNGDNPLKCDMDTYLPNDILVKTDRASMANSLETRVPYLNHNFLEFTATIPFNLKIQGNTTKYIFKKALVGIIPKDVINRKKMGFSVPLKYYFRNELKSMVEQSLIENSYINEYISKENLKKLWNSHISKKADNSYKIFNLLMLNNFLEKFK